MNRIKMKTLLPFFALLLAFSLSLSTLAASTTNDTESAVLPVLSQNTASCLSQYFEMRKLQFGDYQPDVNRLARASFCAESVTTEQAKRNSFIDSWADGLEIDVADVNISYRVKDVLESSSLQDRLLVYEWVMVDYYCKGSDKLETMGFGTNHVITIDRGTKQAKIANDSYDEITGYTVGNSDDLNYLHNLVTPPASEAVADTTSAHPTKVSARASYNYIYAVNYSSQWCGVSVAGTSNQGNPSGYNPSFYYWNSYGGDCANFVSQCLLSGGFKMDPAGDISKGWWAYTHSSQTPKPAVNNEASSAWRGANPLRNYLTQTLGYSETRLTSSTNAKVGNLLYYNVDKKASGPAQHFMIIVGTNSNSSQVLINAHTYDAYKYPVNLSELSQYYYMINLR